MVFSQPDPLMFLFSKVCLDITAVTPPPDRGFDHEEMYRVAFPLLNGGVA